MTKQDIDNYYSQNYNNLINYAKGYIKGYKRNYDPAIVVSEAYLNVINCFNKEKIQTPNDIEKFTKSTIFCKISQSQSNLNTEKKIHQLTSEYNINDNYTSTIDNYNIEYELENIFDGFQEKLHNVDKKLFEIIYIKNIATGKELAKYLNISLSSAHSSIKNLNDKLKLYIKNKTK